ncbi:Phage Tail Collar Domain [[Actinobacillus] rossii]|uniref:Phage Tail Collar Domain n=1 Tax=[Actinobacillus] rossii TaxID=123820 RepID=A0A380TQJ0_9PAST|nr:Phage Tail Collar Domain [[Actinobacillus] rossii]
MYALDNHSGVSVMPTLKSKVFNHNEPRWFTEGGNGVAPSYPGADWFNIVQAELLNVLRDGGIQPDKTQLNQITTAIRRVVKNAVSGGLSGKANASHTHTMANITDLAAAMNAKANLISPTFTGSPKAPTPAQTVNDTTLATTAFVKTAIAALVGSAPATLDTLAEIATALGSDGNLKATLLTEIAKKANKTDLTNGLNGKANLASPTFTGSPKAPTPAQTVNDTTLATTAFVKTAIAALVGSAPATLDTLAEIAKALGSDGNLKATLLTEIAKKANTTDFNKLKNLLVGIPFPYPLAAVPSGCLAFNGQTFNKTTYPILAQKYPSGRLPDLRGVFIRGWDNGKGIDSGRAILTEQMDALQNITGRLTTYRRTDRNLVMPSGAFASIRTQNGSMGSGGADDWAMEVEFNASKVVRTSTETRPRNIAYQYICLAA